MTRLLYSLLLTAGLVLSAPWWLLRMATTRRYREGLRERLGAVPVRLREAVRGKRVVWVHAVSVGEVLAATRLVAELEAALEAASSDVWIVVVSTTTRTGQALARERFGAERVFYFPIDFQWAVRLYLRLLHPSLLVLMESEVWPRMLHECAGLGVPVAVVNARVSDRSFARAMRVRWVWARVLQRVGLWLAQSEEDARRLVAMGVRASTVKVGGNLKYDVRAPKESWVAALIQKAAAGRPIIVAGSTVGQPSDFEEEGNLIRSWESSPRRDYDALLVIAPRHPERFGLVESVVCEFMYAKASAWSALPIGSAFTPEQTSAHNYVRGRKDQLDIILLDTIGDLAAVYGIADVAFVGGSLVKGGGHNPLEPAQFGVPVVMGPSFENFRDIVGKMQAVDGIRIVQDEEGLETALVELLTDRGAAKALGERGRRVFEAQQGATARAVDALLALLPGVTK